MYCMAYGAMGIICKVAADAYGASHLPLCVALSQKDVAQLAGAFDCTERRFVVRLSVTGKCGCSGRLDRNAEPADYRVRLLPQCLHLVWSTCTTQPHNVRFVTLRH